METNIAAVLYEITISVQDLILRAVFSLIESASLYFGEKIFIYQLFAFADIFL